MERLDKIIVEQTKYSRKEVKELVRQKRVIVNGENIDNITEGQKIFFYNATAGQPGLIPHSFIASPFRKADHMLQIFGHSILHAIKDNISILPSDSHPHAPAATSPLRLRRLSR